MLILPEWNVPMIAIFKFQLLLLFLFNLIYTEQILKKGKEKMKRKEKRAC
jgi:hypothetical protein